MATTELRNRDATVTQLQVLIPGPSGPVSCEKATKRELSEALKGCDGFLMGLEDPLLALEGEEFPVIGVRIVPPHAGAAVAGLDGKALRALEKSFGPLSTQELATIKSMAELVDVGRLDPAAWPRALSYIAKTLKQDVREYGPLIKSKADSQQLNAVLLMNAALTELADLCVWMTMGGAVRAGMLTADLASAMIAQLILAINEPVGIAFCRRCEQPYMRAKHDQRFCSFRCESRERQARYRVRQKEKANV